MTPEQRARFYRSMYQAKCEQYDALWHEVEALIAEPVNPFKPMGVPQQPPYGDGMQRLGWTDAQRKANGGTCSCGLFTFTTHGDRVILDGMTHRRGQPCYDTHLGPT